MIKLSCPHCRAAFEAEDYQQGQDFACTTCGAALKVPAAPWQVPPPEVVLPVVSPAGDSGTGTRLRFIIKGMDYGAFGTTASTPEIYQALEEMLAHLGLRVDAGWQFRGMIPHQMTFFCEIKADGDIRQQAGGQEIVLDLHWTPSIPVVAILIAIFIFPVGLILALVFYQQSQTEVKRLIEQRMDAVRRSLTERL